MATSIYVGMAPSAVSYPETTRAAVIEKFGIDSLEIRERPLAPLGDNQVLIRVYAVSLNYRDYLMVTGKYDPKLHTPRIPCSDGAGEVVALGKSVTRVKLGDRVAAIFFQTFLSGKLDSSHNKAALGGSIDGMLSEYVVLHEDGLVHFPEHLSYEEASTLPCAAVTAWNALVTEGQLKSGDSVLVMGTGGVSVFALQFAKMHGAEVLATSSSNDKLTRTAQMGASGRVNYKENPEWQEKVWELTSKRGVDHVVEVGGTGTLPKSLQAAKVSGKIAVIGVLTGISGEIPMGLVLQKHLQVNGIYVGSRENFEDMNRAISLHGLRPVIDREFNFFEAKEALRHMESGAHFGKIVITLK